MEEKGGDLVVNTVFLLGAGFNKDAKREAGLIVGHSMYIGEHQIECDYPLAPDLAEKCFGLKTLKLERSVEEEFADALKQKNYAPLGILYDELMKADYYIVPKLLPGGENPKNCYARFFERFSDSQFLTFNYDSLVELFLLRMERWYPHDGYGVPVEVYVVDGDSLTRTSLSHVLHLHGNLCIYTSEFTVSPRPGSTLGWLTKTTPMYHFDPDSISALFAPYERANPPATGYTPIEERVIAPVPDKARGLRQAFSQRVYSLASKLVAQGT